MKDFTLYLRGNQTETTHFGAPLCCETETIGRNQFPACSPISSLWGLGRVTSISQPRRMYKCNPKKLTVLRGISFKAPSFWVPITYSLERGPEKRGVPPTNELSSATVLRPSLLQRAPGAALGHCRKMRPPGGARCAKVCLIPSHIRRQKCASGWHARNAVAPKQLEDATCKGPPQPNKVCLRRSNLLGKKEKGGKEAGEGPQHKQVSFRKALV